MSTVNPITFTLRPAQLRALSYFEQHPASTLPAMRKALRVDGRTDRAIAALCRTGLLVERGGSYYPNTGALPRVSVPAMPRPPRMPREYASTGAAPAPTGWTSTVGRRPAARAKVPATATPPVVPNGRHVPHRNTSAAQKLVLHFVDQYPGAGVEQTAVACAHMSTRGAAGLERSIARLVARGFLRESRAGALRLAQPLSTLPPSAQPLPLQPRARRAVAPDTQLHIS